MLEDIYLNGTLMSSKFIYIHMLPHICVEVYICTHVHGLCDDTSITPFCAIVVVCLARSDDRNIIGCQQALEAAPTGEDPENICKELSNMVVMIATGKGP